MGCGVGDPPNAKTIKKKKKKSKIVNKKGIITRVSELATLFTIYFCNA